MLTFLDPQSYNVAPGIALPKVLVNQLAKAYSNVSSSPCKFVFSQLVRRIANCHRHQSKNLPKRRYNQRKP